MFFDMKVNMGLAIDHKIDVVHIDETTCSMKTFQQHAWAAVNRNVESKQILINEPNIAIIMAASPNRGVIDFKIKTKSFDSNDFLDFLKSLRISVIK